AQALEQAREARLFVLDKMLAVLPRPRTEMSSYAPRITTILINPDKIRDVIGKGGSMIRKITEETGAQIDVEDDGRVFIAAVDQEGGKRAIDWIKGLTDEDEVGKIYQGKVVRIMPFGAFVEVLPNQDGLVHISKLTDHRVERVEEVCNIGDEIVVKAVEIDSQGRLNLSRQAALEELTSQGLPIEEKISQEAMAVALASPPPAPREGGFGGRDRGGGSGACRRDDRAVERGRRQARDRMQGQARWRHRRPQLRDRRGPDDAPGRHRGPALRRGRGDRDAPRRQARRTVRDRPVDGAAPGGSAQGQTVHA